VAGILSRQCFGHGLGLRFALAASELGKYLGPPHLFSIGGGNSPGVPSYLMKDTGINSGLYDTTIHHPLLWPVKTRDCASLQVADSIPTSLGQERPWLSIGI